MKNFERNFCKMNKSRPNYKSIQVNQYLSKVKDIYIIMTKFRNKFYSFSKSFANTLYKHTCYTL